MEATEAPPREHKGAERKHPERAIYAALRDQVGLSPSQYAASCGISHQLLSARINGTRGRGTRCWTPLAFVERVKADTQGMVGLRDWPYVWDRAKKLRWSFGKLLAAL